ALADSRLPQLYEFDETRLVDTDGDGWPEYVPDLNVDTNPAPPYVYFDGDTVQTTYDDVKIAAAPQLYTIYRPYPSIEDSSLNLKVAGPGVAGIAMWGRAYPYYETLNTNKRVPPLEQKKFQIICAGADGEYATPGYRDRTLPPNDPNPPENPN